MRMESIIPIIIAAGEGTRMKSDTPKVLHTLCGKTMIEYVLKAVEDISTYKPVVVVGHGADRVKEYIGSRVEYVLQKQQLGTGHAVMMAEDHISGINGYAIVIAGDTPLITADTIKKLYKHTVDNDYAATVLTSDAENPFGYGRIVRNADNNVEKIVEQKDADESELKIKEVNSSIYCFNIKYLIESLGKLNNNNAQHEYYLTDVISILINNGHKVGALTTGDFTEIMGVNTKVQLAEAAHIMRRRINDRLMLSGVTIIDPENTYIDDTVEIGKDTVIYPGNVLEGKTLIGSRCVLYPNNRIKDSEVCDNVNIQSSVIMSSFIDEQTTVGPFAYLRPGSKIGRHVRIGDFVEIKNSTIDDESKVSHLTYVGDGNIGKKCNIGCGVVFSNYDGKKKYRTNVGNNVFVGCNTNLVAPVEVKDGSYIAAGSTVTDTVPEDSLCIARSRQVIKEGWAAKRKSED